MEEHQVIVVGAGPAGVSTALALKDAGVPALVLDGAGEVASSWRGRYDRLRLNSCRWFSHLPNRRFPKGTPMFPSRDELIAYLERHAGEDGIELQLGTRVEAVASEDGHWRLSTSAGEMSAPQLIIATGHENVPFTPTWPGREEFGGQILHSGEYRNAQPFQGKDVLVVGPGCSGMEIAYDLAEGGAGRVWLSARTPPNIILRSGPGPIPGDLIALTLLRFPVRFADWFTNFGRRMDLGDLTEYGLPVPDEGVFSRLHRLGVAPAIVDKEVIEAIKERRFEIVRGVESLDPTGVTLADGARVEPDAVVCATGFRLGLEPLVGHLGVLNEDGGPKAVGEHPAARGLRFIGFVVRPASLGLMSKEAVRAAKAISRELRSG